MSAPSGCDGGGPASWQQRAGEVSYSGGVPITTSSAGRAAGLQILEKPIRALGGTWDTRRAVTALRDAGHGDGNQRQQEKRARKSLRDLAATGVIVKIDPDSATYRLAER